MLSYYYYVHDTRPVFKVTLYRRSRDEGASWGDPLYLGLDAVFNDKLLLLKSGRLIAPVEQEQSVEGPRTLSCVNHQGISPTLSPR